MEHSRARVLVALALLSAAAGAPPAGSTVRLNNGVEMPLLSYGANMYNASTCRSATGYALQEGFRFVWSSAIIGEPCQRAQYQAIVESRIPRSELFLAGTVDTKTCTTEAQCYQQTKSGAAKQIEILGNTTLDMLMLDYPSGSGCVGVAAQWRALNEFYAQGQVRTIAVSNFDVEQLRCASAVKPVVVPSVNQLEFNADKHGSTVVADDTKLGVVVQAYSPLGTGSLAKDPVLTKIGQTHGKSAAQVALRWIVQQKVGVNVASTSLKHLQENAAIFDFQLAAEEVAEINGRPPAGFYIATA